MEKSIPKEQLEETKKKLLNAIRLAKPPEMDKGFENLPFDINWGDLDSLFLSVEKRLSSKDSNLGTLIAALTLPRWRVRKGMAIIQPKNAKMVVITNAKTYKIDERVWVN